MRQILLLLLLACFCLQGYSNKSTPNIKKSTNVILVEFSDPDYYIVRIKTKYIVPPGIDVYHDVNHFYIAPELVASDTIVIAPFVNDKRILPPRFHTFPDTLSPDIIFHLGLYVEKPLSNFSSIDKVNKFSSIVEFLVRKSNFYSIPIIEDPIRAVNPDDIGKKVEWDITFESEIDGIVPELNTYQKDYSHDLNPYTAVLKCKGESRLEKDRLANAKKVFVTFKNTALYKILKSNTSVDIQENKIISIKKYEQALVYNKNDRLSGILLLPEYENRYKKYITFTIWLNKQELVTIEKDAIRPEAFNHPSYEIRKFEPLKEYALFWEMGQINKGDVIDFELNITYKDDSYFEDIGDFKNKFTLRGIGPLEYFDSQYLSFTYPSNKTLVEYTKHPCKIDEINHEITYEFNDDKRIDPIKLVFENEYAPDLRFAKKLNFFGGIIFSLIILLIILFRKRYAKKVLRYFLSITLLVIGFVYGTIYYNSILGNIVSDQNLLENFKATNGFILAIPYFICFILSIVFAFPSEK